jgi:hypothetical protein
MWRALHDVYVDDAAGRHPLQFARPEVLRHMA